MYASVPMLAIGVQQYSINAVKLIVFTVICLYSGFFAALIWNDITDVDIDAVSHPDRPIPSGKISKKKFFVIALIFSALTFVFSVLISIICFLIVGFAALFVTFHDKYLKKKVKIPAYSEIFTPFQWIVVALFGFFAVWTALPQTSEIVINISYIGFISTDKTAVLQMLILILFTYFADNAHDLAEGIVDAEGDKKQGVRTYATSFGEKNAARISFTWFLISGILGFLLFFFTILSYVFLVPFIFIWCYIMYHSYRLLKAKPYELKKIGAIVGRKGFDYFLFCYVLIFIDVLIQVLLFNF
jgi:geranylgeranylglycerol-phosphate geranylgeranyltransferase